MYKIGENTKQKMYEMFGRSEKMVDDDVEIIKAWLQTQKHLPEIMDDVKIRNFLNLNKFSIEKTKSKIDMYYTIRGVIPELFEKSNPKLENNRRLIDLIYFAPFPTLLDELHRIHYVKPNKPNTLSPVDISHVWFSMFEIRLYEDFMVDDIVVFDMKNVSLGDLTKSTPTILSKFFAIYKKVYALRVNKLLYINCPSYVTTFATILKSVLTPKIFDRVQFYPNEKIFSEIFSKEFIPKDYGGDGPSLLELNKTVWSKFDQYQSRFDQLDVLKVNENLRPEKLDNDEILGFYGSFKKIDVD